MRDIVDFGDGKISVVFCCNCELYSESYGICRRTGMPCVGPTDGCSYGFIKKSMRHSEVNNKDGYGHNVVRADA